MADPTPAIGICRPPLLPGGHVLVFSSSLHLPTQGSAVVMRNLMSCFDPGSFTVVTYGPPPAPSEASLPGVRILHLHSGRRLRYRLGNWWRRLRQPWLDRWATRLAKGLAPALILGIYPDAHLMQAARVAAKNAKIPLLAYFHDLLEEVWATTSQAEAARRLQQAVFGEAASILVMGQGMAGHYRSKGYPSRCLEHIYPEPIEPRPQPAEISDTVFIGGSVYDVNDASIKRMLEASRIAGLEMVLATGAGRGNLQRLGISGAGLTVIEPAERRAYLERLRHQGILAVGFNWPDESGTPEIELATAFPTKVVEYLVAGRPILVHCPEHYFLARFFRQHECGLVVSERSPAALATAIQDLLQDSSALARQRTNALAAARIFTPDRIVGILKEEALQASGLAWGVQNPRSIPHVHSDSPSLQGGSGA